MLLTSPVETSAEFDAVLAKLEEITLQLHECADLDTLLDCGVRQTRQLFGCDRALVYQFVDNGDGAVTAESVADNWPPTLGQLIYDPCFETNWGERFRQGHIRTINDVEREDLDACYVNLMRQLQVRANLVSPILVSQSPTKQPFISQLWGLLIVHRCRGPFSWRDLHRRVIRQIATQLGLAIQHLQLLQQLAHQAEDQAQWLAALDVARYGTWDWEVEASRILISSQLKTLLGYAEAELDNSLATWESLLHPADRARVNTAIARHWRQETPAYRCEYRLLNQSGQWQWVLGQGKVTERRADGSPVRFIGIVVDISDRKRSELRLAQQIQRETALRTLVNAIHSSLELEQIFNLAVDPIADCVQSWVLIWQYLPEEECWRPQALSRPPANQETAHANQLRNDIPDRGNALTARLKRQERVQVDNAEELRDLGCADTLALVQTFPGAWLILPIVVQEQVWGGLALARLAPTAPWSPDDVTLAQHVANKLAIAIHQSQLYQQLQATNRRDELALQGINEGIWDWDLLTDRIQVSERYWEILGYSPAEQGPFTHAAEKLARIHPEDRPAYWENEQAHFHARQPCHREVRIQHQDGHYLWVRERGQAVWNDQGTPIRMVGSIEDISDRKAMEARLRQQEADFRSLVENNPDGILRVDRQLRFLYVNPIVESRTGLPREEFIGRTLLEVGMPLSLLQLWQAAIAQVFATGQEQLLETEETLAFGEHTFYSRIVPEFNDQGEIRSALIISRDMSNLRAAQQALQQRAEQEHTLRLISQHIRETLDLEVILSTTVNEVQRSLQADRTLIFRLHSDHSGQVIAEAVAPNWPVTLAMRWADEHFIPACYNFAAQEQGQIVPDIPQNTWDECLVDFMQAIGGQSQMVAPIIQHLNDGLIVWGFLITYACSTQRQWQPQELSLLQQVADQLAIAIQQSELHQRLQAANRELERLSTTDALTQIANRRHFDDVLQREWQRSQREQRELALVLCDIDYFKQYNDTYGHPAGDDCIVAVAQALQNCINRSIDCIARYGGEEFAIILPHTAIAGAIVVVQNMQAAIAELAIAHASHEFADHITLSFGITATVPRPAITVPMLIRWADQALYRAKQSGRDGYAIVQEEGR